jgi:hypothetical protein
MAPRPKKSTPTEVEPPKGFEIARDLPVGRHPILTAFPGLDKLPLGLRIVKDPPARRELFDETCVEIVDQDMWMYVAPHEVPKITRGRWNPVVSPDVDCIVIGKSHLRESPALMLFMDIYHELCHVVQRKGGANLFEPGVSYVKRWTEVEAYRFVVDEARKLGVSDDFLRDYLKVEWISAEEHRELLTELGVPVS